ncbi:pap2 domain protein [Moniliophthora roreri MCA 2997]|uniref:Pap2 domain protein n=1 Tax=Moniliophthora roreri (strain MCA 2997) TaxID=1381753 RepID=V2XJ70_MONRO|nr:pap2 domain protein [Moniliophthora roreri MCA 2997]
MINNYEHHEKPDGHVHFELDVDSAPSSRAASPTPERSGAQKAYLYHTEAGNYLDPRFEVSPPGRQRLDVYDATLSWWRAGIRKKLVKTVAKESRVIAKMQDAIRTPWLDAYFVYTSSLGTHTFFMTVLPALFFFGYTELGLGLVLVLATGVYFSSFFKDLFCSPRPFAPPVTRLTIGSHHLEYGFPSTHSTNSVSIALFFFSHIYMLATPTPNAEAAISPETYAILVGILLWYAFSIVFGRLYTAMHSFTDCAMGVFLGAGLWWILTDFPGVPINVPSILLYPFVSLDSSFATINLFRGLGLCARLGTWVDNAGWQVPLFLIPLTLLLVNQHPQPVDDCPCFEDAIAFISVVLGVLISRWVLSFFNLSSLITPTPMPGSGWTLVFDLNPDGPVWIPLTRHWDDIMSWWFTAALKMVFGILVIFVWRLVAKSLLHLVLPPIIRFFAGLVTLPNRRFYTPATDYKSVPSEFRFDPEHPGESLSGLRPIPSVIDLPGSLGVEIGDEGAIATNVLGNGNGKSGGSEIKLRTKSGNGQVITENRRGSEEGFEKEIVKHYDAEVLTKVIVYSGIAALASGALPIAFEAFGWGVRSMPPGM